MALQKLIPVGLNTDVSEVNLRVGEGAVATDVDLEGLPGGSQRRLGSAMWYDNTGNGGSHVNHKIFTLGNGNVYVMVKFNGTSSNGIAFRKIYPSLDAGFTTIKSWSNTVGLEPGSFECRNGLLYYFNSAVNFYWDGAACWNVGLQPPTGFVTGVGTDTGQLMGIYLWAFNIYDETRKVMSNLTIAGPIGSDSPSTGGPTVGIACFQETSITLMTWVKATLAKVSGDHVTSLKLWRTLGHATVLTDQREYDAGGNYISGRIQYQLTPLYGVTTVSWDGTNAFGSALIDGYADGSLDRTDVAMIQDNYPPPLCSYSAIYHDTAYYFTLGGEMQWSVQGFLEQIPLQESYSHLWGGLWTGMTKTLEEHRSTVNAFTGPLTGLSLGGNGLYAFTYGGTYLILGGQNAYVQPIPTQHGCVGPWAYCYAPNGRLFAMSSQGLIEWPGGIEVDQQRFSEIWKSANRTYLANSVIGYNGRDDSIMVVVPQGSQTKAATCYVLGQKRKTVAKWNFAWATTNGITGIETVNIPGALPYVLFFTDSGNIYKYPDSETASGYLDAGAAYGGTLSMVFGTDFGKRKMPAEIKRNSGLWAFFGTIGAVSSGSVNVSVTAINPQELTSRADVPGNGYDYTKSNRVMRLVEQLVAKDGSYFRLTVSTPAGATYGWQVQSMTADLEFERGS